MSECGILHLEGTSDLPMGLFLKEKGISLCLFLLFPRPRTCVICVTVRCCRVCEIIKSVVGSTKN